MGFSILEGILNSRACGILFLFLSNAKNWVLRPVEVLMFSTSSGLRVSYCAMNVGASEVNLKEESLN